MSLKGYNMLYQDLNKDVMYETLVPNYVLNHDLLQGDSIKLTFEGDYTDSCNSLARVTTGDDGKLEDSPGAQLNMISCSWSDMVDDSLDLLKNCPDIQRRRNTCKLILACECTYRTENYRDLAMIIAQYLDRENGRAYIATKRFYFGLSGGTFQFVDFVNTFEQGSLLKAEVLYSNSLKNSSNFVDIIQVRRV
ncbi:hypothetical protein BEWA_049910 [Theileria equi strain WA]|uniref:Uncharacterized protein n=1 Tax=Theileria equi strain WA TaxID=1537102 RepID=L1LBH2_THEEQ|nr:hypothetical protein BEWA_049910 [Theileria equi strain WA]EKX72523.1 hypothetical protein BEWA_049910 [Theileria equi strain WA]|eukprot:XP_004831975.1 hypothetical protein BEWA_049910 [Theileria equi strain WA]